MQTVEQFARKLTESGLISVTELQEFRDTLPPEHESNAADDLSKKLVENRILTDYQVDALSSEAPTPLVVGDYVVLEKVGAGGMGVVFKAQHRRMKRNVALKMLPPNFSQDESAIRRFEREVEVAAKLNHRNIVAALDAREENGNHYLIMEFVEGSALTTIVERDGTLPVPIAVDYIMQAAYGFSHAHQLGVIHRDVKPSNLMVDDDGTVKILDMGLARIDLPGGDSLAKTQTNLTSAGVVMGTINYVSPEQALDSRSVDFRTDIYSLGCTLYFLLVGRSIYSGETPMKVLVAHREQPIPSLRDDRPEVPAELDAIFRKMVAKKTEDRFQSMSELITSLHTYLGLVAPSADLMDAEEVVDKPVEETAKPVSEINKSVSVIAEAFSEAAVAVSRAVVARAVVTHTPNPSETGRRKPVSKMQAEISHTPGLVRSWKRNAVLMTGRGTGATLGVFAGISLASRFGGIAIAIGVLAYLWFGWKLGDGYARMFAYQVGWTHVRPESLSGRLFQIEKLKLHAIAVLIGAMVGTWTIGVLSGVFVALTILAVLDRPQTRD